MVNVVKASGEKESFSEEKVMNSIKRAGIPHNIQHEVLSHVKEGLYENIPTSEIYKHIIEFLRKSESPLNAAKYSLKEGIMQLGPTGYPFEDYVSEILIAQGWSTKVRQILVGKCVQHEIDVIAEKEGRKIMIEAKFHNGPGIKSDVHVALYTKARFDDIKEKHGFTEAWIVTNTKVTQDALSYAHCENMITISWNYPDNESLSDLVEKEKLYPITSVSSLTNAQKQLLLLNGVVLCRNVCINPAQLKVLGLDSDQEQKVLSELNFLCQLSN